MSEINEKKIKRDRDSDILIAVNKKSASKLNWRLKKNSLEAII